PLAVHVVTKQRADIDRGRPQQEVLCPRDLAEPVDAVGIGPEQGFVEHRERRLEPAADHLELAYPLVRLLASEPFADPAHGLPERNVERAESRGGVLTREPDRRPASVFAEGRREAQGLFPALRLAQPCRHPPVRDVEPLARSRAVDVAVFFRAVDPDAVERVARDARPPDLLATVEAKL